MTNKLEQEFYNIFEIKPYTYFDCLANYTVYDEPCSRENCQSCGAYQKLLHKPEITIDKLLQIICIYNDFQNDVESLFIPSDYKNIKSQVLKIIVKEINDIHKNNYFCNDIEKLRIKIQELFNS